MNQLTKVHIQFISWKKGLHGQNVDSSYSKAVDSAHSSVRVSNSRQSNDVLGKAQIRDYFLSFTIWLVFVTQSINIRHQYFILL